MERRQKAMRMGALTLGVGAIISKILGAVYRIPLISIIGGEGVGIYQLVFPVYTVLLDFAGGAFPSAISKIVSSFHGEDSKKRSYSLFKSALWLCTVLGGVASLLMIIFAKPLASAQGDSRAYISYIFLAPAVFFVALISCYRGYFQGLMDMKPTAKSQVIEQTVKLIFGLSFAKLFMPNLSLSAGGATLAVTVSEVVAFLYVFSLFKRRKITGESPKKEENRKNIKTLIKIAVPITLIGIAIPFSQVIDSFLMVNIMGKYRSDATMLYGLLSGASMTVINLPVSVCYGISASVIPAVSGEREGEKQKSAQNAMLLTLAVSVISAVAVYFLSPFAVKILFRGLRNSEAEITVRLIRLLSPSVALLSLIQTSNGALIGMNKVYSPLISLGGGIIVKTVINLLLLPNPTLNVFGGAIAINACYFFTCLVNLILLISNGAKYESSRIKSWGYAN